MKKKFRSVKAAIILCLMISSLLFAQSYIRQTPTIEFGPSQTVSAESLDTNKGKINKLVSEQDDALKQSKFEQDLSRLRKFREEGTLDELINAGDEIEKQWGESGGNDYAKLFREFLSILNSTRYIDKNVMELSRNLTAQALEKADTFDLEYERKILLFLGGFDYPSDKLDVDLMQKRQERVKLWLHAIRRLETEKDNNFNPEDLPHLKITPPPTTGLPAGVSPEAIRDEKLRDEYKKAIVANGEKMKNYNKQFSLRQSEDSLVKDAVNYIATAYSKPPIKRAELDKLLDEYHIPENIRGMIKVQIQSSK